MILNNFYHKNIFCLVFKREFEKYVHRPNLRFKNIQRWVEDLYADEIFSKILENNGDFKVVKEKLPERLPFPEIANSMIWTNPSTNGN